MPNSGTLTSSSISSTAGVSNLSEAAVSDDSYANAQQLGAGGPTPFNLTLKSYGAAIPTGATIDGIEVSVERSLTGIIDADNDVADDVSVRLLKAGVATGDDKATAGHWPAADAVKTYGGAADLWGTTWTPAQINSTEFGVYFGWSVTSTSGTTLTSLVDAITVKVYYTGGGGESGVAFLLAMIGKP